MALLKNLNDFDINGKKGDWCFLNGDSYIALRYGEDAFKGTVVLRIKPEEGAVSWTWDGNREAPTLSPSILVWGEGRDKPATWHGFLRAGKLETV
jgi:hypothetical protein